MIATNTKLANEFTKAYFAHEQSMRMMATMSTTSEAEKQENLDRTADTLVQAIRTICQPQ